MRRSIYPAVLTICCVVFPVSEGFAQLICRDFWTAEYKCLEHCGPCPTIVRNPPEQRQQQRQLDLERQRELQRLQEEAERKQKADEADQKGLDAAHRGDWKEAADWFMEALTHAPDSSELQAHLDWANREFADVGTAADIRAMRQRIVDSMTAAKLQALRQKTEDDATAQRLRAMSEAFFSRGDTAPVVDLHGLGSGPMYPVLLRPVPPASPPARVLRQYQPKIQSVDEKIHEAQRALRRVLESNSRNQKLREEWVKESNEATVDAQDLSLSLLLDLIGAHVDHLAATNREEKAVVLQHLLTRAEENGPQNSIHSAYGALVNRKEELERIKLELRLAGKENDLRVKIREFDMEKGKKPTVENAWDLINSFETVEEMAGPTKDLMDATYTIYRQAMSVRLLSAARVNDEKTLQAAASLQRYIQRLEAKKKAEKVGIARQMP